MSVYTDCTEAARELLANPQKRPMTRGVPPGIFTELDVIMLAARERPWGIGSQEAWMRGASATVNSAMTYLFKEGHTIRYGPVEISGLKPDYLRFMSKIIYAAPDGPDSIRTPNGVFGQITLLNNRLSGLGRAGRRHGYNRNDFEAWSDQQIGGRVFLFDSTNERRITSLVVENETLQRRVEELEAENSRLRGQSARSSSQSGAVAS